MREAVRHCAVSQEVRVPTVGFMRRQGTPRRWHGPLLRCVPQRSKLASAFLVFSNLYLYLSSDDGPSDKRVRLAFLFIIII